MAARVLFVSILLIRIYLPVRCCCQKFTSLSFIRTSCANYIGAGCGGNWHKKRHTTITTCNASHCFYQKNCVKQNSVIIMKEWMCMFLCFAWTFYINIRSFTFERHVHTHTSIYTKRTWCARIYSNQYIYSPLYRYFLSSMHQRIEYLMYIKKEESAFFAWNIVIEVWPTKGHRR